jgi:hypothetical protein
MSNEDHVEFYQETVTPHQDEETGLRDWRWRVKAGNGEIVASGEGYTRREDAERGFRAAARSMSVAYVAYMSGS